MSRRRSRWFAIIPLATVLVLAACGSAATGTPPPAGSTPGGATTAPGVSAPPLVTPKITTAAASCLTADTVGAALGITVQAPVSVVGGGGTLLPAGSKSVVCEYHGTGLNVIIEVITNTDPSYISKFTAKFPATPVSVPGVGDQAWSFLVQLGGGKDNEGVAAAKGSTIVTIGATATPASLKQVEDLVTTLL